MKKVFTIGGNGLVGSRVAEILQSDFSFTDLSRSSGVDITNPGSLKIIANDSEHEWVILYAAKTDVDGSEQEKDLKEKSEAWRINVDGVKNVVAVCQKANKKLLHISTDFVFDGEKGNYSEEDATHAINWYGETKLRGEEAVRNSSLHWIVVRISFPFAFLNGKKHFVQAMYNRLKSNQPIKGVTDEIFAPTFIDDFAHAVKLLLERDEKGIFHVPGAHAFSPYDIAMKIAETFNFDTALISQTTREEYFAGKAMRPKDTSLNSDKIKRLGLSLTTIDDALERIKQTM